MGYLCLEAASLLVSPSLFLVLVRESLEEESLCGWSVAGERLVGREVVFNRGRQIFY